MAKEFAIAFTFAVTEVSANPREWIAKNGRDSIFAVLQEIYPEASNEQHYICITQNPLWTAALSMDS
jgi:hypothetical protein